MTGTTIRIIAHRANLDSYTLDADSNSINIRKILDKTKFDVEIDIWKIGNYLYTGHDKPSYLVYDFLENVLLSSDRILFHAKNIEVYKYLLDKQANVFWHQNDDYALTRERKIVVFPGKVPIKDSIVMRPELYPLESLKDVYAVCTDYPEMWSDILWK